MGRVRPIFIKKISKELILKYSDVFTNDFDKNKQLLEKFVSIPSKLIRNRIAGYIVHLIKMKDREEDSSQMVN